MEYTVHQGKRYAARIYLNLFESMASNEEIARRFRLVGFIGVSVDGSGSERIARGLWVGDTTTTKLPSQIVEVKELDDEV